MATAPPKDFVIQGGCPSDDQHRRSRVLGEGGGARQTRTTRSARSPWAKAGSEAAGTMGSQFFIVTGRGGASLPNDYALFGSVSRARDAREIVSFAPKAPPATARRRPEGPIDKVTITES